MFIQENESKKRVVHFIDFRSSSGGAYSMEMFRRGDYMYKIKLDPSDLKPILKYLNDKDYPGKIDPLGFRLYLSAETAGEEYIVDQNGRVLRQSGEQYVMSPLSFLYLNDYLDHLKHKNGIKQGSPHYK